MCLVVAAVTYGFTNKGELIVAPDGWVILPEGAIVPPVHCECSARGRWMTPRMGRNRPATRVAGHRSDIVRCVAVPIITEGST
jgi:hypothetical protein